MAMRDLTGAVDFAYLEAYTGGDVQIVEEVLRLFQQQCELWSPLLTPAHEGWRDAAHTLKGAAAGIGANALSQVAGEAEAGDAEGAAGRLERVRTAMDAALYDVAAYLHGLQLRSLRG
jgi:HPt (histidine-containing phosphotransfer) domain-containing protein